MALARLAARLYNAPLLITPEKAEVIESVFREYAEGRKVTPPEPVEPAALAMERAAIELGLRPTQGGYFVSSTTGIALVPVHGSLVQRAGGMEAMSGLTGYNRVASQFNAALRDPYVRGVMLEFDSPGGEVPGVIELAALIGGADKPVYAHANEFAASAAYWLASATQRLYAPVTGMVGSIGVVYLHVDRSKAIDKAGLVYTPITYGARKVEGSSLAPLSEDARARIQGRINQVGEMFVAAVARERDMDEDEVRATEAGVFSIQDAIALGLADEIATLGEAMQSMADDLSSGSLRGPKVYQRAAAGAFHEGNEMNEDKKPAAQQPPAAITPEQLAAARAEGVAEGQAAALKNAPPAPQADAGEVAKTRIKAITQHAEAKDRPALAAHLAFDTDLSAEAAVAVLAKAAKEATPNPLANAMGALGNPKVGADSGDAPTTKASIDTGAIYAAMKTGPQLFAVK